MECCCIQLVTENVYFAENHCNFRDQPGTKLKINHVNTEKYGIQSESYLRPKI